MLADAEKICITIPSTPYNNNVNGTVDQLSVSQKAKESASVSGTAADSYRDPM